MTLKFSLRTVFVAVACAALSVAAVRYCARQIAMNEAIRSLRSYGAHIKYITASDAFDVNLSACQHNLTESLLAVTSLPNVRYLGLAGLELSSTDFQQMSALQTLDELDISRTTIDSGAYESLSEFRQLRVLRANDVDVSDNMLAYCQGLLNLEEVHLRGTFITGEGLRYLWNNPQLRVLILKNAKLTDDGCLGLGRMNQLKTLDLSENAITDVALAGLRGNTMLEWLDISQTDVVGTGLVHLGRSLKYLNLGKGIGGGEKVEAWCNCDAGENGIAKFLGSTIGPRCAVNLKRIGGLRGLEHLDLYCAALDRDALGEISQLPNLTELDLEGATLEGEGVQLLAESKSLRLVILKGVDVSRSHVTQLKRALEGRGGTLKF